MTVIIGIDPHKASHTAVAIGCDERQVAEIKVRATCQQTTRLLAWAEPVLSENSNLASCRHLVLMDESAPTGRVDVSVLDGDGDAGADCQKFVPPVAEQLSSAPEPPERFPGAGDARCSGGRSCAGCARGGLRSRPAGGRGTPISRCAPTVRRRRLRSE